MTTTVRLPARVAYLAGGAAGASSPANAGAAAGLGWGIGVRACRRRIRQVGQPDALVNQRPPGQPLG